VASKFHSDKVAVVFARNVLLWVTNGLASVTRGTGKMLVPPGDAGVRR